MQELIEFMHGDYSKYDVYKKATELLETEREQIEEAVSIAIQSSCFCMPADAKESAKEYYKDTYQ